MNKITFFDVEYANSQNKSICQIGLWCEDLESGELEYELSLLVNPEDNFDSINMRIHGITPDKVKDEITFPEAWKIIERYFTNAIVVGHNVLSADLDALMKSLNRYEIAIPEFYYICTYQLAQKLIDKNIVGNYKLSTLCDYFGINVEEEHDAYYDAIACRNVFHEFVDNYGIDVDSVVRKCEIKEFDEFNEYNAEPNVRNELNDLKWKLKNFNLDSSISVEEKEYLEKWYDSYVKYDKNEDIKTVLDCLAQVLKDGIVSIEESELLIKTIDRAIEDIKGSPITIATQDLSAMLKAIVVDEKINAEEIDSLSKWVYEHDYLKGHYPFDQIIKILNKVLEDEIIDEDEETELLVAINKLIAPIPENNCENICLNGKTICLSGDFAYGSKGDVGKYIEEKGGIVVSGVSKKLNLLVIGDYGSAAYSNGNYGTKVKKAMELKDKGVNIEIISEKEFFKL